MMKKSPRRRSSKKMQPVAVTPKQRPGPRRSWTRAGLRLIIWAALAWIGLSVLLVLPFRWLPPPTSSFMLQYYFEHGDMARRHWVSHRMIAPAMALAVVAAEDQKFPDHSGFDYQSIQEAVADKLDGKPLRGASTISQQVAKNLYLWSGRSLARKGLEAWLTLWIELLWPKQRILEVYLNIAEFGKGVYGADAASQRFFRKPAATLSEYEAALLAAVLPNPVLYRADAPSAYVRERQRWILRQMRQLGGVGYIGGIWSQGP